MLTFRHYCDSPLYASAAGYKFSIGDSISVAAINIGTFMKLPVELIRDFPDWEMREAPERLITLLISIIAAAAYPFAFWIFGIVLHVKCKWYTRKYRHKSQTVINNLKRWKEDCDRRFNG